MNYYQHHIGDFNNATRHLSRVERSIYSDLLDLYYDSEKPLTADFDKLARRILVEDNERGALREVLNEFFVAMEDGYHNERCDKEIASYQRMAEGGKLGAAKRWAKPGDSQGMAPLSPPHAKGNANHEPVTKNQEPITKNKTERTARATRLPDDFFPDIEFARQNHIANEAQEFEKFKDYWKAQPGQKGVKLDWQATWRNWCRNAKPSFSKAGHVNKQEALEASNRAVVQRLLAKEAQYAQQ